MLGTEFKVPAAFGIGGSELATCRWPKPQRPMRRRAAHRRVCSSNAPQPGSSQVGGEQVGRRVAELPVAKSENNGPSPRGQNFDWQLHSCPSIYPRTAALVRTSDLHGGAA